MCKEKKIIMITFNKNGNIEPVLGLSFGFLVYLQTRLFAPVWLVYESFLWEEFSVKVGPTKPKKSHNLAG